MKVLHCDGYTIGGNPSRTGGGFTIFDQETRTLVFTHRIFRNPVSDSPLFTNNEAELLAAVFALTMVEVGGIVVTDSENTRAWIASGKPKARPDLAWLAGIGKALVEHKKVTLEWRPREVNLAGMYNEEKYNA
jgi:ribonuclease HI